MKNFLIALTGLGCLPLIALSQKPTDKRLQGLDTFVTRVLKDWHAPGVAIAVVEKDKVVYTGGFGFRDLEKKLPVTENTLFAIGSCTKAFTAALVGILETDGKLSLDKPVRNYLPELKFQNEYANAHVTLRDMMCHRTGLPRHDLSWYGSSATRSELLERIQYLEPNAELRARYQYNNFMFMAQGVVTEKITGKSWEENMKERIFTPLSMNNTVLSIGEMEKSSDHSLAYTLKNDSIPLVIPYRNIDAIGPAGSANSCAKDMANWLITWIKGGKFKDKQIIPSSYVADAITVQMATGGGLPGAEYPDIHFSGYGLGWTMGSYRGHYRVEHGGGIDGFITTTSFFPSDSIGIFVVSSQGSPSSAIRNFIADRMLKLSYRNWNNYLLESAKKAKESAKPTTKSDSLNRKFNTKPSHVATEYAGMYTNPGYGNFEIMTDKDSLRARFNSFALKLQHFHYDQFNAIPEGENPLNFDPLRVSFYLDGKGDVEKFTVPLQGADKEIEFKKELKMLAVTKTELEKYEGEYELGPQSIRFAVKNNNVLWAMITGQPDYELVPVKKDEFNLKIMKGYSVRFEANDSGKIVAAYFIQPNGTFKATRKK
jgi:CubicO group peptidase (beta-lactamase class C family)